VLIWRKNSRHVLNFRSKISKVQFLRDRKCTVCSIQRRTGRFFRQIPDARCLFEFCAFFLLSHCILCTLACVSLHSVQSPSCCIAFPALHWFCISGVCSEHTSQNMYISSSGRTVLHLKVCRQVFLPECLVFSFYL
jgi:hypothetical protein